MSITFDVGDVTVWDASNAPARIFKGHAESFADALKVPSGLGKIANDICEIDFPVFEAFVATLVERYEASTHPILRALTFAFIPTAEVLIERAGGVIPKATPQQETVWAAMRKEHAASMAR